MSKPIQQLVDELPTNNLTISALRSLDFIAPGEWENTVGFVNTIKIVTGETDEDLIQQISDRAIYLYNDRSQGYQRALWLYQTVDITDKALKAQALDLSLKLVAELAAFCQINGIPNDSIGDFIGALGDYSRESFIRMAALVCFDGLIPLGPDFANKALSRISQTSPHELEENATFQNIKEVIPGQNSGSKLSFIGESFNSVKSWMGDLVVSHHLTPKKVASNLQGFINFSDDKLDYLGAFLDVSTNYYEHTGTQTVARRLIERAVAEI
jgi:hypothetical protein